METHKLNGRSPGHIFSLVALSLWLMAVVYVGFVPGQSDFTHIILPYTLAFVAYLWCLQRAGSGLLKIMVLTAILARVALVFSFPQLSDDVFRFIWDGRVWHEGLNPYAHLPNDLLGRSPALNPELYAQLNSQGYYTVYPPVAQAIFYTGGLFTSAGIGMEVIAQKLCMLMFELVVLSIIFKLLAAYGLDRKRVLVYALNPLVVVEIMGNMHHEGIMFFFILLAIWFLHRKKPLAGSAAFAFSVASKMLPLMFGPALFFWLGKRRKWVFAAATGLILVLLFAPLLLATGTTFNFGSSLDLYLRKFEFNGGLYYVLRWFGYLIKGYNIIHILGPILAASALAGILFLAWKVKSHTASLHLWTVFLASFTLYLLLSMTVHPWYVILPVGICLFTDYRFPVYWSYLIAWTYINYSYPEYHENLIVVFVEYAVVYWLIYREIRRIGFGLVEDKKPEAVIFRG